MKGLLSTGPTLSSFENNEHLLNCPKLLGSNKIVLYILSYKELFGIELNEQVYISQILHENFKITFYIV